jgi:hypothetical protein
MTGSSSVSSVPLSWTRSDPEQRLAFRGARFTRVNVLLSLVVAALLTVTFYLALAPLEKAYFAEMFVARGPMPYCIAFLFFWSVAILLFKLLKLLVQRRALEHQVIPEDPDFVLSPTSVDEVLKKIYETVDDPKQFVLTETSFSLVTGFVWAIPVLGFVGTVMGLSQAISGFGGVLATAETIDRLKPALKEVTGGLAVAFETTLIGLLAALVVQLMLTFLKKAEEEFLDDCNEYCVRYVVGRLRLVPAERSGE